MRRIHSSLTFITTPIFILMVSLLFVIGSCGGGGGGGGGGGSSSSSTDTPDTGTGTGTDTGSGDTDSGDTGNSSTLTIATPANFETILTRTLSLTPTSKTSISNRDRVLVKYNNSYMATNSNYTIELNATLSTYDNLMLQTFQLIEESSSSCYRLDSEKHSIYSIDYDASTMKLNMRNNWGFDRDANSAYLCFTFDTTNNTMTASKRFTFNTTTRNFDEDSSFTSASVFYDESSSSFILSSSASNISLEDSGVDVSLPTDFNPNNTAFASNSRVAWETRVTESFSDHFLSGDRLFKDTHSTYQSQIQTAGSDSSTATAAETMLNQIKSDLEGIGASLRYDTSVYLAFRNALLNTKLQGATIVNGQVDQNTAPYVFFTNESDDSGTKHPFMVIGSYSIADKPNRLLDVPVPPGDGLTDSFETQSVTRDAALQTFLLKIPLKNYGTVNSFTDNSMDNSLANDVNESNLTIYNYASIAAIGVAVDGVQIYPPLNNTLATAQNKAEITNTGIHVGRGLGLHWHADGHGATGNGLNLYNLSDYDGNSHPPLIGFGFDGVALYGKYESNFSSMDGFGEALDSFGGHDHGDYGYHYHAHSESSSVVNDTTDYTLHILMKGAWKGTINSVPEFWDNGAPNVSGSQKHRYVGNAEAISN